MENLIGKTIKNYQILQKVRETATRILYRVCDTHKDEYFGLEIIKIENINQKALFALLREQEIKNSKLSHPNIAPVMDSGIFEGSIYFVFKFSPVRTLRRSFNQTLSWNQSAREFITIAQAMAYAHQEGIVHGNLDPSNIILDENNTPFLYAFGFEQIIQNYVISHSPGAWIKTWKYPYSSPEQLSGNPVDTRSDVYSMGIILYEWMTGEIPILDETTLGTLYRRMTSSNQELNLRKIDPPEIYELIAKSIAADPSERYQSMQEFSIVLAREALGLGLTKRIVRNPMDAREDKNKTGKKWVLFPVVLLLSLMAAVIVFAWMPGGFPKKQVSSTLTATISPMIQAPTGTEIQPQPVLPATVTAAQPTAEAIENPIGFTPLYPLFEGNALPALEEIDENNAYRLIMLGVWGAGEINRFTLSEDGKYLAAATSMGVFIYDAETLEPVKHIYTGTWISTVDFSPDGKMIATGDLSGLIVVWDTTTWNQLKNYKGHKAGIIDLAFSPEGGSFVSIALDNTLIKWEINQEADADHITQSVANVSAVAYSPDGNSIITGGNDWRINIWDAKDLKLLRTKGIQSKVVDIKYISQSTYIAVGGADRSVTVIDLNGEETFKPFIGLQYALSSIAIAPDGNILAAGDVNGGLIAWDRTGNVLWKSPRVNLLEAPKSELLSRRHVLLFSLDGKKIFSGLRNGIVRVFDASTGQKNQQKGSINNIVIRFDISHDSKTGFFQTIDKTIDVWDINQGTKKYSVPGELKPGTAISSDDRLFAVMFDPAIIKVQDTSTGNEIFSLKGHTSVQAISFINQDSFLAVWNAEKAMRLWSVISGQEIKTNKEFDKYTCTIISSLEKEPLFSITAYNHIFENPTYNSVLCGFPIAGQGDAFLINEATGQVLVGGNRKLEVYDFTRMDNKIQMDGADRLRIVIVAINPSGSLLAAASDDNSIRIWNVKSRKEIVRLDGHENSITDLRFTGDGKILVSTSLDGTIRLWGIP